MRGIRTGLKGQLPLLVAAVAIGAVIGPVAAQGASRLVSVLITNTAAHPVPVKVHGGSVGVSGAVSVSGGSVRVSGGSVSVSNDAAHQLAVSEGTPYRATFSFNIAAHQAVGQVGVPIPAGKVFVIRHVNAITDDLGGPIQLAIDTDNNHGSTFMLITSTGVNSTSTLDTATEITAAGNVVGVRATTDSGRIPNADDNVSGTLDGVLVPAT